MAYAPAVQDDVAHDELEHGMSVEEYGALIDRGVLGDDAQVELLDGRIVSVSPQGDPHSEVIRHLMVRLAPAIHDLRVQLPLVLAPTSEPEPDLALADHVGPRKARSARLVIEVVVTTWRDALRKLPIYAEAGIGEYWIVHAPKRCVHVHDQPAGRAYGRERVLAGDDVLAPPGTDIRFTVAELFAFLDED